jgi:hypothetical protein
MRGRRRFCNRRSRRLRGVGMGMFPAKDVSVWDREEWGKNGEGGCTVMRARVPPAE